MTIIRQEATKWRADFRLSKTRYRKLFNTKAEAEAFEAQTRLDRPDLTAQEIEHLAEDARRGGYALMTRKELLALPPVDVICNSGISIEECIENAHTLQNMLPARGMWVLYDPTYGANSPMYVGDDPKALVREWMEAD